MPDVVVRGTPLALGAAGERNAECAVGVAALRRERVVRAEDEPRRQFHRACCIAGVGTPRLMLMLVESGCVLRFRIVDRLGSRWRNGDPADPINRRIEILATQQTQDVRPGVGGADTDARRHRLLHAGAETTSVTRGRCRSHPVLVGRRDHALAAGIGEARVRDVQLLLTETIDAQVCS